MCEIEIHEPLTKYIWNSIKENERRRKRRRANKLQSISLWAFEILFAFESRSDFRFCCLPKPQTNRIISKIQCWCVEHFWQSVVGRVESCEPQALFQIETQEVKQFLFLFLFRYVDDLMLTSIESKVFSEIKSEKKRCQTIEINGWRAK